uniref:Cytochrome P450 2F2-like n=2 Tax=Denticeps clupeoides TaxID=299321 RepID=A0AAY4DZ94_9TELE
MQSLHAQGPSTTLERIKPKVQNSAAAFIMVGSLVLLWICFSLLFFLLRTQRPRNFPPGPRLFPLFGNLLQLSLANPMKDFERLSKQYGKVFSFFIGSKPAVVLTGVESIKEALVNKAGDFSGRPHDLLISHVTENKGVIMANYGPSWKDHRRFALMTLRNFGLGKQSMEQRILGEVSHITTCLEKSIGKSMSPQTLFHKASSNIICSILLGVRNDYEDSFLESIISIFIENAKMANGPWAMIYDTFPMLRCLPLPFRRAFRNAVILKKMANNMISEHKKTRTPGEPRDFIDCYLDELEKRGDDGSFHESQLVMYILDLQIAGTETTSNTLLTAFLYLATHPDVQERCQQEIDEVLQDNNCPSFEDRHKMPYVQAVIHESQRVGDIVPLSVFHSTVTDTELMGYNIPKGTLIIPNLSSTLSQENQWKFPHEFNPSNFLDDQGQFVKPEAFMPFSVGPRMCLGEGLARMELFLFLVCLLQRFKFVWPEDAGKPDYTPVFGVTLSPRPYKMDVRLRKNN